MGWGSGASLLREIAFMADPYIYGDKASEFYGKLIELFEQMDCDTIDEAEGTSPYLDKAIAKWKEQFEDW